MQTKIYFLIFFLFLFWTYCLYWPFKKQKKINTPVEFFIYGRQMPGWIFTLVATTTIFSGWFFMAHPSLIFVNASFLNPSAASENVPKLELEFVIDASAPFIMLK